MRLCDLARQPETPKGLSLGVLGSASLSSSLSLCNLWAADVQGGAPGFIRITGGFCWVE